jgi:hypothetical protein
MGGQGKSSGLDSARRLDTRRRQVTTRYLPVVCGDTTCFDFDTKTMCSFVRVSHFGTKWSCAAFTTELNDTGILQRCEECKLTVQTVVSLL